jgi:hypothetical protein
VAGWPHDIFEADDSPLAPAFALGHHGDPRERSPSRAMIESLS